jgi:hypothetical protein
LLDRYGLYSASNVVSRAWREFFYELPRTKATGT